MSKPEEKETHQDKVLKLLENLNENQKKTIELLSPNKPTTPTPTPSDSKHHETLEEIANCPNCRPGYKVDEYNAKIEKEWMKKQRENVNLFPDICDPTKGGCGLGVNHEKEDSCPNCGKREARKR